MFNRIDLPVYVQYVRALYGGLLKIRKCKNLNGTEFELIHESLNVNPPDDFDVRHKLQREQKN